VHAYDFDCLRVSIASVYLCDLAFMFRLVHIYMSYQYRACTRGNYESCCAYDWRTRKEKIADKFKLEDPKFDSYCDSSIFSDWLANMECYFDWYGFLEVARVLFVRRKFIRSARIYWDLIVRDCMRRRVVIESWEEMKEKFKEKYLSEYYKNRLVN